MSFIFGDVLHAEIRLISLFPLPMKQKPLGRYMIIGCEGNITKIIACFDVGFSLLGSPRRCLAPRRVVEIIRDRPLMFRY